MGIVSFGYGTSAGMARQRNEDSLCVHPDIGLWAVADGMGGYRAGNTASRMTVEHLARDIRDRMPLAAAISAIHRQIISFARSDPAYESMGSTVVALQTDGNTYEIAWVGDSRAYLWDGRQLIRLTRDHSYVQSLVDSGAISEAEADRHPERNAITQALGAESIEELRVDTVRGELAGNQQILLCSDGLTSEVDDGAIAAILAEGAPEQASVDRLIALANKNGGADNISVILLRAAGSPDPAAAPNSRPEPPSLWQKLKNWIIGVP